MASLIYHKALHALVKGDIDFDTVTVKVMLTTSAYTENKDTHDFRDDVTNEVTGTGYTAGGTASTVTVNAIDTTNDRVEVTLGAVSWPTATITARKAVYYVSRGGASSADELLAVVDFGSDVVSTAATFSLSASTIRLQN
jgi:hypothetical protein